MFNFIKAALEHLHKAVNFIKRQPNGNNESKKIGTHKNRVLILGNGFDLDCGFDTTYETFGKTHFSDDKLENYAWSEMFLFLKERFAKSRKEKNWFSLEDEIRNYVLTRDSKKLSMVENDQNYFTQLIQSLRDFENILATTTPWKEREEFVHSNENVSGLFINPIQIGIRKYSVAYNILKKIVNNNSYFTNIISFNYTNIRNVLNCVVGENYGYSQPQFDIRKELLPPIQHIHCNFENGCIVLGIEKNISNDKNQEVKIPESYGFLQKCNQFSLEERRSAIKKIMSADELVIFGHSLGKADADYFRPLFKDMFADNPSHERRITFITYNDNKAILNQISLFAGRNIVTHHSYKNLSFIYTSVEESGMAYSNLFNDMS